MSDPHDSTQGEIERLRRENAELREREETLNLSQRVASVGSWEWDFATNEVRWSDEMFRIFGIRREDFTGSLEDSSRGFHPDDRARIEAGTQAALAGRSSPGEYRVLRPDGTERIVWGRGEIVRDADGEPVRMVGTILDITERKRTERALQQAQKMESMGRLAGGIAHDFNNLLTVILGNAEIAQARPHLDGTTRQELEEITDAARRAANLTRQLLAYARKQIVDPRVSDLNEIVEQMNELLTRLLMEDIEVTLDLADGLWPVKLDPGQMEQVLLNLVVNARDAMPAGGTLTVRTYNDSFKIRAARKMGVQPGDWVILEISDTGGGIDPSCHEQVFEPFFTTKPRGKGTGLGLATSQGLVEQNGGHIALESTLRVGSTFRVLMPRSEEPLVRRPKRERRAPRPGSETILVVEDEPAVRQMMAAALERRGYRVLSAADGEEAMERARAHADELDLLVTDIVLPHLSGKRVAEEVEKICPGIPVMFASGYTDDIIAEHGVLEDGIRLLHKPFTPSELVRAVRTVLDE